MSVEVEDELAFNRHEAQQLAKMAQQWIRSGEISKLLSYFEDGSADFEKDLVSIGAAYDGDVPHAKDRELVCRLELIEGVDLGFPEDEYQPYFNWHTVPGRPGDLWLKRRIREWYKELKESYAAVPVSFTQGDKWMLRKFPTPWLGKSAKELEFTLF